MKTVKEIFEAQGYTYVKDGRNRVHRSLQKLLDSGLITFRLCQNGMALRDKSDGFVYNVSVSVKVGDSKYKYFRYKFNGEVTAYYVLKLIGKTLQADSVKEILKSYVNIDCSCQKCQGIGYIRMFSYYCDGICFDCYGLGYNTNFKPIVELTN